MKFKCLSDVVKKLSHIGYIFLFFPKTLVFQPSRKRKEHYLNVIAERIFCPTLPKLTVYRGYFNKSPGTTRYADSARWENSVSVENCGMRCRDAAQRASFQILTEKVTPF